MKQIYQIDTEQLGFHEQLQRELSSYPVKNIEKDGSVAIHHVQDPYFLVNNSWNVGFLENIPQFQEMVEMYKGNRNVHFRISSPTVNLEAKYIWYQKLFKDECAFGSIFNAQATRLNKLTTFLNEKYPNLSSLLDLDIDQAEREWLFWLAQKGIPTQCKRKDVIRGVYTSTSTVASFLRFIHSHFFVLTDTREEWEKDRWDVRVLHNKYGINYNKTLPAYHVDFTQIEQMEIRQHIKKYIKQRLLSKNHFSWGTARSYLAYLPSFLSLIFSLEPSWMNLKGLKRSHMERYIQWLHEYAKNNLTRKNAHPERYILNGLNFIGKFLEDIQRYEYDIAPDTNIRLLLFPEDKPKLKKKSIDQIDYIPDYVLEQLFMHIDNLHKEVVPVVWVAYKTGLRISDVLGLNSNCLERINGKYSIVTDIEKTYVQGHRIPIDEELANILAVLIHKSKKNSNQENNPEGFIFVRYRGSRKGKPYDQKWVQNQLNTLAKQKNIVDENGKLFYFKLHQFRHTYAVKLLNGGADILTVQELLAHASPEMTMRYAKLLDKTKRKAFEAAINNGVFHFDSNGKVQEIKAGEDIPEGILQALWQDHKLNAMENNYGTCHARLSGSCPYMEEAPCLTCNGGSPCKDLAIGFSDFDIGKYEDHIKRTSRNMELAKQYGREDIVEKGSRNLKRYEEILRKLQEGNVIFGRMERMKRKQGVENG
ncbi:tyrosine-type recombinase/integrase [Bacillus cytotoxicus]|uniref:Tyrosine-type recombinase/integrase n=1 Tax=Bacillus cytotoxicus TaxID=580165 RepID=A0ACC6A8D2_9BACI|nr:tyrosine-type recombinase/integrase [Bacillus cytotoxicus]